MNDNRVGLCLTLVLNIALLCSCATQPEQKLVPPVSESQKQEKTLDQSIAELKRLYEAAQSQYERRAVSLQAIDEGTVRQGRPVSTVDSIFGTHFASNLPVGKGAIEKDFVYFGPSVGSPSRPDGVKVGFGYIGWSMEIEYDDEGKIQRYYLSNLWKSHSSYEQAMEGRTSIKELRRLYESAQSATERREVCLRAIDEGAVQNHLSVTTIDALFSTKIASQLPTKKEVSKTALINFVSPSAAAPEKHQAQGWFMAVEYDYNGNIQDYYLTNITTRLEP